MERLDKFLANSGIGTRSEVKKYMKNGRIHVNGEVVKSPDRKVDPDHDVILFDGSRIQYEEYEYYMLNKPQNCVTATEDRHDQTVMDYIISERKDMLFPVGRLDKDTEGLLLITNDGDLSHKLLAPKKHVDKIYFATVTGIVTDQEKDTFENGLDIGDDKLTLPAKLTLLGTAKDTTDVEVTISEGRFHQIKRMFQAIGHEVIFLKRLSMGPLKLDDSLNPGESRSLSQEELNALLALK